MKHKWLLDRMRAMSFREILWRIRQKQIKELEKRTLKTSEKQPVYQVGLPAEIDLLQPDISRLPVNWKNESHSVFASLRLPGDFSYERFKTAWNAGFQTGNTWPEDRYTYHISYAGRSDIGDIRTNWELNRHYQFANLAKNFYITADSRYLGELAALFYSWNEHNPFLYGVEWSSPMEAAIRVNSWTVTYLFLAKAEVHARDQKAITELEAKLDHGIKAMVSYILKHYSRFSSANNHLIMELYAVCLSGLLYGYDKWINFAVGMLTSELPKQNFGDGVNREMSLHYQCLDMEAYGLLLKFLKYNNREIPEQWYFFLQRMSEFTCDCCGDYGETVVFGDDDGGKIMDLSGKQFDYYRYVLDLMSLVLDERYSELKDVNENINWLFSGEEIHRSAGKKRYTPPECHCYREGGYTILRSKDRKILVGIDHAELGFGKIAAHGHADALSFQMFYEGVPVLADPGTFNYHITPTDRDYFRSTVNHNTVTVAGRNQSEILGPFLWGTKANCKVEKVTENKEAIEIIAVAKYRGLEHKRVYVFDRSTRIEIEDHITGADRKNAELSLMLGPAFTVRRQTEDVLLAAGSKADVWIELTGAGRPVISTEQYSPSYNEKTEIQGIRARIVDGTSKTVITVLETGDNGN